MLAALVLALGAPAFIRPAEPPREDPAFFVAFHVLLDPPGFFEYLPRETAAPAVEDGGARVWAGTRDGSVWCIDRGRVRWHSRVAGSVVAGPTYVAEPLETLYVSTAGGELVSLNAVTGAKRWTYLAKEELLTAPVVSGGAVYAQSSAGTIFSVDASTGKFRWKQSREATGTFTIRGEARPHVHGDAVYAAFDDGHALALNASDGTVRWDAAVAPTGEYVDLDGAAEADGNLYVAGFSTGVTALEEATGNPAWKSAFPTAHRLALVGTRVVASGVGEVRAFARRNGRLEWTFKTGGHPAPALGPPAGSGDDVVVPIEGGALLFLDAATGRLRAAFDPGTGFAGRATVVGNALFAISNGGELYGLGLLP